MYNLTSKENINLKNDKNITEKMIQDYIVNHPNELGIDESNTLELIGREKIQKEGGRVDLLFENEEQTRYVVEVQLGRVDSSHIIRTIEYWDNENRRNPKYKYYAVIIAEEITGRFFNILNILYKSIPIIVIQMSAHKENDNQISLFFNKILDATEYEEDSEDIDENTTYDRKYWEQKSNKNILEIVDQIFEELKNNYEDVDLNYNKHYIGIKEKGVSNNYFSFVPKKHLLKLRVRSKQNDNIENDFAQQGFSVDFYSRGGAHYTIAIRNIDDYYKINSIVLKILNNEYN